MIGAILLDHMAKSRKPAHVLGLGYEVESPVVQFAAQAISETARGGKDVVVTFIGEVALARKIESVCGASWADWKRTGRLPSRNQMCLCGSRKKFKKCCMRRIEDVRGN